MSYLRLWREGRSEKLLAQVREVRTLQVKREAHVAVCEALERNRYVTLSVSGDRMITRRDINTKGKVASSAAFVCGCMCGYVYIGNSISFPIATAVAPSARETDRRLG